MDQSQAEPSVPDTDRHVAQDFLGFIRGLKKYRRTVEVCLLEQQREQISSILSSRKQNRQK